MPSKKPPRPRKKARRITRAAEKLVSEFVAGLDLAHLYQLVKICRDAREEVSFTNFRYRDEPPTEAAMGVFVVELDEAFPEIKDILGLAAVREAILKAYESGEAEDCEAVLGKRWQTASELRHRREYNKKLDITDSMPQGLQLLLDELSFRLHAFGEAAGGRVESTGWDRLEKAEKWLSECVCGGSSFSFGDQEAIVYLASRGKMLPEQVEQVVRWWREAQESQICDHSRIGDERPTGDDERRKYVRKVLEEAEDNTSHARLQLASGSFWGGHDKEELIIDATMLRTAEWCDVGGFDLWWQVWADDVRDQIAHGGFGSGPGTACWMFAICRSELAMRLLGDGLTSALWSLQLGTHDKAAPWRIYSVADDNPRVREHTDIASAILFAASRARDVKLDPGLLEKAGDLLLRSQSPCGGWHAWNDSPKPNIESTATAVHALALARPRGWQHAIKTAVEWLWSQQDSFGCWSEDASSGFAAYLTVLVLDAIELGTGGSSVTFKMPRTEAAESEGAVEETASEATGSEDDGVYPHHVRMQGIQCELSKSQRQIVEHMWDRGTSPRRDVCKAVDAWRYGPENQAIHSMLDKLNANLRNAGIKQQYHFRDGHVTKE